MKSAQFGDVVLDRLGSLPPNKTLESIESDPDAAVQFLKALDSTGWHNLVAIDPNGQAPIEGKTFPPGSWAKIRLWVGERSGRLNLYYSVNEPKPGSPDKKLSKSDICQIRAAHADVDPDKDVLNFKSERERLLRIADKVAKDALPPSFITDSGNGLNLIWRLSKPMDVDLATTVERINKAIGNRFGGDHTQNIDRILRLPGTVNLPDAKKCTIGRVPAPARLLRSADQSHPFSSIAAAYPSEPESRHSGSNADEKAIRIEQAHALLDWSVVIAADTFEELPANLLSRFTSAMERDRKLAALWQEGNVDRSAGRIALAWALRRAGGFTVNEFGALLWVWPLAVHAGEDVEDKITEREISRAWGKAHFDIGGVEEWFDVLPDIAGPPSALSNAELSPAGGRSFDLVHGSELLESGADDSALPLVKGLLDQGALSVLYGESNTGKTFVAMDLAFHIAIGTNWGGLRTARLAVVYVAAEGGVGIKRRYRALAKRYGNEIAAMAAFHFRLAPVDLLRADSDLAGMIKAISGIADVGFVVIDTLSRALAGGDENASTDMGALVRNVDRLRKATGAHVMLVHHSGKDKARGARGHSLLRAATDTEIEIAQNEITVTKQRDMDGNFRRSFVLDPVDLGADCDGDPISSCVLRLVSQAELPAGQPTEAEGQVLNALKNLHEDNPSKPGFKVEAIMGEMPIGGHPVQKETLRTRLRGMEAKRLLSRPKPGIWAFKPVETRSTGLLDALD